MWDEAKALLEGKFTSLRAYIKEKEKYQVNNVSSHLRELEEEEQNKSKTNRRKGILKISPVINEIENRKTIEKINETKIWFFEKISTAYKPLVRLTK